MPLSVQEDKTSKFRSEISKSLQELIQIACTQCRDPCSRFRTLSCSSLPDDLSLHSDLDHEQVIMLEIQSRALMMKAKKTDQPEDQFVFSGRRAWAGPPAPGRVRGASGEKTDDGGDEERGEIIEDDETESEAFFTVKSCFSHSCSSAAARPSESELRGSSVLEGFRHCQGWPFGLYHKALVLPPLPSSPADSWMWHKRNLVTGRYVIN